MNLVERVGYEEWANAEWRATLPKFSQSERVGEIFAHIFSAYSRWLTEISEWEHREADVAVYVADPAQIYAGMREAASGDLDRMVEFVSRRTGLRAELSVEQVLSHMMNHGTYHRGHLRGLAEAEGITDFPDTDELFYWKKHLR